MIPRIKVTLTFTGGGKPPVIATQENMTPFSAMDFIARSFERMPEMSADACKVKFSPQPSWRRIPKEVKAKLDDSVKLAEKHFKDAARAVEGSKEFQPHMEWLNTLDKELRERIMLLMSAHATATLCINRSAESALALWRRIRDLDDEYTSHMDPPIPEENS